MGYSRVSQFSVKKQRLRPARVRKRSFTELPGQNRLSHALHRQSEAQASWRRQNLECAPMKIVSNNGFTLIELLVTLSVAAVLLSIATPSFVAMNERNRITTYTNNFVTALNYARAEAVRRGTTVTVCISTNGTS